MSLLNHAPSLGADEAVRLAAEWYGLGGAAQPLASERDQNFLIDTGTDRFVLKIANGTESGEFLEAQYAALEHLAGRVEFCPVPVATRDGDHFGRTSGGQFVWLVRWIDGTPLAAVRHRPSALFAHFGTILGRLDEALIGFDHAAVHRAFHWDLARAFETIQDRLPLVDDDALRTLVGQLVDDLESRVSPMLGRLRRSVIHNDANDYNVLVGGGNDLFTRHHHVVGIIDFGDMVHSYTVADPAIAIAYAILDRPDPLATAAQIVAGYHEARPFDEDELCALLPFVELRLCLSICMAASQLRQRPGDEYLAISQAAIRRTLPHVTTIPARFAEAAFRRACGLDAVPAGHRVRRWLEQCGRERPAVIVGDEPLTHTTLLDLSVSSPVVSGDPRDNEAGPLGARIDAVLRDAGARVGIGRYLEPRILYSSPLFVAAEPSGEHRTIHLGVDLFVPSGTPVSAPIEGVVHLMAVNDAALDYGPVAILEHRTEGGERFFTLYGHLSRASLDALKRGQRIARGERFATVGERVENGGWPPHLHFQVIVDLLGLGCDFPGVCRASEAGIWSGFSPDPSLLLGLTPQSLPDEPPQSRATLTERRSRIGRNVCVAYREPLKIARGWMQYVFDSTGRRFVDAYNNVPHVGHCHPAVVRAAHDQARVLNTNTRYLHDLLQEVAFRITSTLPDPLRVCYFVNSGSEANELALRLAGTFTGQRDVIVLDAAYHGNTTTLIDISPYKFNGPGGEGRRPWVHVAPLPDVFRGPYRKPDPQAGARYANHVGEIVAALAHIGRSPAAFIAETCPSVGGQIILPNGYLREVYRHVRHAGGVCIADEVQTAYGRMGTSFYAFEPHHVVPDIVVLGKPIGNGHPLGAVVTTDEIATAFDNGMEFFSTFGGSTVSCAIGLAVLDVVQREGLQEHARSVGDALLRDLDALAARYPLVGDVRGSGLFIGVELVRNRATLAPAAAEADYVVNRMRDCGVLIGTEGPNHNVLKIRPPMPFDEGDAARLVSTLDAVLWELDSVNVNRSSGDQENGKQEIRRSGER